MSPNAVDIAGATGGERNDQPPAMSAKRKVAITFAGAILAGTTGAAIYVAMSPDQATTGIASRGGAEVLVANGVSRLPSTTAEDWATYADHVLIATAVSDSPLTNDSSSDGGMGLRTVSLKVDEVLWTSPLAAKSPPNSLSLVAVGFVTKDNGRVIPAAMEGSPRLEPGHTYLAAVSWVDARCSQGDPEEPAHYEPLGEHAMVPFDDGVVGQGEFEGKLRTAGEAILDSSRKPLAQQTLGDTVAGGDGEALVAALNNAPVGPRQTFVKPAPCN